MKKLFTSLLLITLCFLLKPQLTFAHFPATDGDMTVTLHVDPNDDPTPEKQAHLYFLFNDKTHKFKLANCNCIVSVTELGGKPYTHKLSALKNSKSSIWGATMPYIFPERNVYHIVFTGKPTKVKAFQPFIVSWFFRVDTFNPGLVQTQKGIPDIVVLVGALMVVIVGLILFGLFIKREFSTS